MITAMIATVTGLCCFSAGTVFGACWAGSRRNADCRFLLGEIDERDATIKRLKDRAANLLSANIGLHLRVSEYRAARTRSTANLIRANANRKAKRMEREAAAAALRNKTHASLRELVGG